MANNYLRSKRRPAHGWRLLGLAGVLLAGRAQAQAAFSFFSDDAGARQAAAVSPLKAAVPAARPLTLNVAGLRTALGTAPPETTAGAQPLLLTLPLPDGRNATFRVQEAPVMAPALAAQFPDIKTYVGQGVEDPTASLRLDLTPQGFHAQVLSGTTGSFYIDPTVRAAATPTTYLSFWKRDMPGQPFTCEVPSSAKARPAGQRGAAPAQRTIGPTLRTYRLAVAATAEYTAFQSRNLPAGSTPAQQIAVAQAAIVTSVNRVVGVYEKEMAVRMVLVANNSSLIYTDATTDPYDNTNSNGVLLSQNQTNVDALIGSANYDIGHVFSTAGGGLAGLGVVCTAGQKAQGETGTNSPTADAFDIDYVAHEMGHQFGANHTFNGTGGSCGGGNRNASTAYEPGSGTTIMAYAGICGTANDVQQHSDAYFHVVSYEEIQDYLATTSCAAVTSTGNNPPTVAALPASGKVLPIGTPFKLTARGYDSDGDALAYDWEEYDLGTGGSPTATQTTNNNVPLFRSFYPTASPTRYFPRLSDIVGNTATLGERLPTVARTLTFRVTLRDHFTPANTGFGTAIGGVNSSQPVSMTTTAAAGPFVVTAPNTAVSWAGGSTQPVTWDVAGTTANGVNCATVNILLSTDGGLTYPTTLLAGVPNNGTATVTVPNVATTTARVMVEAADNYFFDISNANFTITTAAPCGTASNVTVSNVTATTATVNFTAGSSATSYLVTTSPATTTQTVTGTTATLTGLTTGATYTVFVQSVCASNSTSTAASATFSTTPPPVCNEVANVTVSNAVGTTATVSFTATSAATGYTVTTSPATTTYTITGTTVNLTGLAPGVAYTVLIASNCVGGGTALATVTVATPPLNDECTGAVPLLTAAACTTTNGSISGATQSQGPATCSQAVSATAADVWYSFVATATTQTVRVTSTFDAVVQALRGSCGSLTAVQCVDLVGAGTETLTLNGLTVNTRYYVRVYPYVDFPSATTGTFTICVTGTAPTCTAPTNLVVSNTSGTTAALSFTNSVLGGSYTVTTTPATTTYTVATPPLNLTGLTPGTNYTVSVVGTCADGTVLPAATTTFTSASALAAAPALTAATVSIFPNPTHGGFLVQLPPVPGAATAQATLLTVLGQPLATRTATLTAGGARLSFDAQGLAAGVYLLRLTAGDHTLTQRVTVE